MLRLCTDTYIHLSFGPPRRQLRRGDRGRTTLQTSSFQAVHRIQAPEICLVITTSWLFTTLIKNHLRTSALRVRCVSFVSAGRTRIASGLFPSLSLLAPVHNCSSPQHRWQTNSRRRAASAHFPLPDIDDDDHEVAGTSILTGTNLPPRTTYTLWSLPMPTTLRTRAELRLPLMMIDDR